MKGDKGMMGICREGEKGDKGDMGLKGDSCRGSDEFIGRNETYVGPKGEKGMIGMKVRLSLSCSNNFPVASINESNKT